MLTQPVHVRQMMKLLGHDLADRGNAEKSHRVEITVAMAENELAAAPECVSAFV